MKQLSQSLLVLLLACGLMLNAQDKDKVERSLRGYTNPGDLVTFSPNLPFSTAIELLSRVSELRTGKKIVATFQDGQAIEVDVINMHYLTVLNMLARMNNAIIEEGEETIFIKRTSQQALVRDPKKWASLDAREVKISAVFFESDVTKLKEQGINWDFLLSGRGIDIGASLTSTSGQGESGGNNSGTSSISSSGNVELGQFKGNVNALFRMFESENIGEIIASPNITVRDQEKGKIQVGSDFSIKTLDFAGNVTDVFFSTGSIISVTPYIYNEDGIDYVLVDLEVERSSGFPSEISTEIKKTQAKTQVLLLDGEETIIGGLFQNEEQVSRTGIPFLKDLPWWVLGIRYLTGSDQINVIKKELIILIKVQLLPTLKERIQTVKEKNALQDARKDYDERLKYLNPESPLEEKKDKE
mgnify:CR=1 FL=1